MRRLSVYIEIKGTQVCVGEICGNTPEDAVFSYAKEYMEKQGAVPISLSLPFSDSAFSPARTKNFLRVCFRKDLPEDVFAAVQSGFEKALSRAAAFLTEQGFASAEEIQKRILQKGGIRYLRSEMG